MKIILVSYFACSLLDIYDLVDVYDGYFDGGKQAVVFPYSEELIEELENRGIQFKVVLL